MRFVRHSTTLSPCCLAAITATALCAGGCGTTRWSDTKRTATEQLLVSDAVERAVMRIDMRPLAGSGVFLDAAFMDDVTDGKYLVSALRHRLVASDCRLVEKREDADVIVEARAGAVGTDRNDLLLGVPATSVSIAGNGTSLPEMALAKRTDQRAVAKVSLFAYERATGRPVWQSGFQNVASHTRDRWMFGTGPFKDGDIYDRVEFAGRQIRKQRRDSQDGGDAPAETQAVDLSQPRVFATLPEPAAPTEDRLVTADASSTDLTPVR
ncbi:MAG: hypothetical protein EBR23_04475 [Planctomycetia bacterium]|nr:hypothetical protein [Planctomycetia bacterium]